MNNRELFYNYVAQTSPFPLALEITRSRGVYLYDKDDKLYIDLISGISVSNIGHCHPNVTKAIKEQVDKHLYLMVYGEFIHSPQSQLAEALKSTLPDSLDNIFFVNSGSEATEGALKLAKRYTGRSKLISCKNAYHGSTHGPLSLVSDENYKRKFRPLLPDIEHIEFNNVNSLDIINSEVAAVILEPIQGEAGIVIPDIGFLTALKERCNKHDVLLIFDEVQTGFGRTGKFWAFEHFNIIPDIVLTAKGMGGGMPIGAFISNKKIMSTLSDTPILGHISTFGGHPVSCASSLATVNTILDENLLEHCNEKGKLICELLNHKLITAKRQIGLMIAIEFKSFEILKPIIDKAIELGVLTDWFLFNDHSMRIAPPLTITKDEIEIACNIILQAIDTVNQK